MTFIEETVRNTFKGCSTDLDSLVIGYAQTALIEINETMKNSGNASRFTLSELQLDHYGLYMKDENGKEKCIATLGKRQPNSGYFLNAIISRKAGSIFRISSHEEKDAFVACLTALVYRNMSEDEQRRICEFVNKSQPPKPEPVPVG